MSERFDIAIIGSGPAGLSAAINAKIRNKSFILIGSDNLSSKLVKAHEVNNYLGFYGKSGEELAKLFKRHIDDMDIHITDEHVSNIYPSGDYYSILTKENMYEATTVILATGVDFGKPYSGEKEYIGRGVSYCATCDAMFFKEKAVAVIGFSPKEEAEADFLVNIAAKVYYIPMYDGEVSVTDNIEIIKDKVIAIEGEDKVERLVLKERTLALDGVFILRESIAPDQLVPGISVKDNHVEVDRSMTTSIPGCFAAGDITGKPYQYIKAAGEGNVAALSAVSYLDALKRKGI